MSTIELSENAQVSVNISEDKQKAFITPTAPAGDGEPLSIQLIKDALREAGVVHGIDEEAISILVKSPQYGRKELVAKATPPTKGQDAIINFLFPLTSEGKPKLLPNGSVDFKQLDIIKNIHEGEVVCSKTPASKGDPGTDVLGGTIEPQSGKDVPLPRGQNTIESENGLELLAKVGGQVDYINNRVSVMNVFNIDENVDYNTGNIDFVGNVTVGGDICAGFYVRAEGNVFIRGCVDGGIIEAGGNVTVTNGFNGQSSGKITCGGNLRCKYLQNAHVDVGTDLETTSCVNSIVHVGGIAKFIGNQAMLLASRVTAGQSVQALNVGSIGSSVGNVIEAGVNPRLTQRMGHLPVEINQYNKNIENLNKVITLYSQLEALNKLPEDKKAELSRLRATLENTKHELLMLNTEKQDIEQKIQKLGFGTINIMGTAFAGTQIVIGSERMLLTADYEFTRFTRAQDGIHTSPARK